VFGGFTGSDFEAYAEHKWRSNAFSLERLAVKEKLVALGRELAAVAVAADGSELHREPSTEHPALWNQKRVDAQHLFFSRDPETRNQLDHFIERSRTLASLIQDPSPQRSHAVLAISIDVARLSVALRLHTDALIDRENLEAKTRDEALRAELLATLHALPPPFSAAVGARQPSAASLLDADALESLVSELGRPLGPGQSRWLTCGRDFARAEVLAAGTRTLEQVRGALVGLLPVFHFVAWTRDNDHIGLGQRMRAEAKAKQHRGLAKNDRVRVVSGMFSGRVGLVQELDARGSLKVLVGKIPIVVDAQDVEKM